MTDKDVLELWNMFTTAAQIAKSKNQVEYHLEINEVVLAELLKKAFPSMKNNEKVINIARNILKTNKNSFQNF